MHIVITNQFHCMQKRTEKLIPVQQRFERHVTFTAIFQAWSDPIVLLAIA